MKAISEITNYLKDPKLGKIMQYLEENPNYKDDDEGDKEPKPTSDEEVEMVNKIFVEIEAKECQMKIEAMEASEAAKQNENITVILPVMAPEKSTASVVE